MARFYPLHSGSSGQVLPAPVRLQWPGFARSGSGSYLLHAVVHRQQRLQPLPLQHVGELHVDGLHGARVAHDPVLVWVWGVVVTGSTGGKERGEESEITNILDHQPIKTQLF